MSSNQPPSATGELHRQLSSSTDNFSKLLPQTPSPITPTTVNAMLTNSTPASNLAAAFGRAISNIPLTSLQDANTTAANTLLRTLSDANSSANHATNTPPKVPRNEPLSRIVSDPITVDYEQIKTKKTPRVSSSPQSSAGKQRLRKLEDMLREIEHRCLEIMKEEELVEEDVNPNPNPNPNSNPNLSPPQPQEQEECVGVERLKNGDLKFELGCSCGKKFEMLIQHNGYCFYKLA